MRLGDPTKTFIKTLKAVRPNGQTVEIDEYLIKGTDPTSTGTIWRNSASFPVHKLRAGGEDVEVYDDGTAMITGTGEMLRIVQ